MSDLTDIQSLGDEELILEHRAAGTGSDFLHETKDEILRRMRGPEWVSVEDRNPDVGDKVLCWYRNGPPGIKARVQGEDWSDGGWPITHWKPIQPPQSDE